MRKQEPRPPPLLALNRYSTFYHVFICNMCMYTIAKNVFSFGGFLLLIMAYIEARHRAFVGLLAQAQSYHFSTCLTSKRKVIK